MADRTKFEKMLELLINEDREGAEALFHEIVVEKSRDIYESLLEDDAEIEEESDDEVDEANDEEVDESDDELDESEDEEVDESDDDVDEGFNLDEFEVEADPMSMMGGDPTDDMMGDVDMDAGGDDMGMDMDMGDGGDVNDRMDDLEDALEALKAEFEAMMGGEGEEEGDDEEEEEEEEGEDEEGEEEPEKEAFSPAFEAKAEKKDDKKAKKSATEEMREYVEKIGGQTYNTYGKMGDNGANTKSIVAKPNNMGGTSANIVNTGTEKSPVEANKGQLKGNGLLKGSPKDMSTKNVNVPGGKAGVKHLSKQSGGGLDNNSILKTDHSDKSAQSTLNKVSTRAK